MELIINLFWIGLIICVALFVFRIVFTLIIGMGAAVIFGIVAICKFVFGSKND